MYPTEVVGDIWAEYPVVTVVTAVGVLSALVVYRCAARSCHRRRWSRH